MSCFFLPLEVRSHAYFHGKDVQFVIIMHVKRINNIKITCYICSQTNYVSESPSWILSIPYRYHFMLDNILLWENSLYIISNEKIPTFI